MTGDVKVLIEGKIPQSDSVIGLSIMHSNSEASSSSETPGTLAGHRYCVSVTRLARPYGFGDLFFADL